jgi:LysM repeat protein
MTSEKISKPTKICPTCGTRVIEDAPRCLVCGTDLTVSEKASRPAKSAVQGSRMPEITLSVPAALGLLALFLAIGAILVFLALCQNQAKPAAAAPTTVASVTPTLLPTLSPTPVTPTITNTPLPSPTPLVYVVKNGDLCGAIAFAFHVSVQSIVLENPELPADCGNLVVGQKLNIPQPTPTATPPATSTLTAAEATNAACSKADYTVQSNDTLGAIAANYAVPKEAIAKYNGLVNDFVRVGQKLVIPLCERASTPGPSPTPSPPPPYPAPNLLLPPDGSPFTLADDSVTLQWASVGALRDNESYAVTFEDITSGNGLKLAQYVLDTKYVIPSTFRPNDNLPHVFRWFVLTVRQVGTDDSGNPIYQPAGAASAPRVFTWVGTGIAATPTP